MGSNISSPEIILLLLVAWLIYGVVLLIDCFRRPESLFRLGKKNMWTFLLIVLNPIVLDILAAIIIQSVFQGISKNVLVLIGFIASIPVFLTYHFRIKRNNPISKKQVEEQKVAS